MDQPAWLFHWLKHDKVVTIQNPSKVYSQSNRRRITGKANVPDTQASSVPPVQNASFLPSRLTGQAPIRATWLGHACYHVEFASGLRVLFDPVFSDRCSPFSWLGPKRYTKVPCQIEDIPFIDAVMISHNHYDHCDQPTLERIAKTHTNAHFFVPLKNKELITSFGIQADRVTELDWWEEATLELSTAQEKSTVSKDTNASTDQGSGKIVARIGALPCQHMGNRGLTDRGKTLWSSWSVETGGKKLWFGGDTGYRAVPDLPDSVDDYGEGHDYPRCPAFAEIGRHRGPFDLGLIPIGAYQPRFVMSPMHGNPEDAVNIFQDTKCKRAMAIHWGTWVLTEEDVLEPPQRLKVALKKYGLPETGTFDVCDIGESREFN